MQTKILHEDHKRFTMMCEKIEVVCENAMDASNARLIYQLMETLVGELVIHLSNEDKYLYPVLVKDNSASVREIAESFKEKMGGLSGDIQSHMSRWDPQTAVGDRVGYVSELYDLLGNIRSRIKKEDTLLFPLIDN